MAIDTGSRLPIRYVDDDAVPGGDGLSWATAYADLQDAITDAELSNGAVTEIRVAGGVYTPTRCEDPNDPRSATFSLPNGVAMRGGYAGRPSWHIDDRDLRAHPTILSGDLLGDDEPGLGGSSWGDNAYHVVLADDRSSGLGPPTLDGFIITRGNADGLASYSNLGGGLLANEVSPTIQDCAFVENWAYRGGGAAFAHDGTHPLIVRCTFDSNVAMDGGGGLYFKKDDSPTFLTCVIRNNLALDGGGVYFYESVPLTMRSCVIEGNEAVRSGGGIYWKDTIADISNLTVVRNHADAGGGLYAVAEVYEDIAVVSSSIIWANSADLGKQIALASDPHGPTDRLILRFCDLGGGEESIAVIDPGLWRIQSKACLDQNPAFLPALDGGFHLSPLSPCIDAGDPEYVAPKFETDIDRDYRVVNDRVDIGADEFVPDGSIKAFAQPARAGSGGVSALPMR